MLALDYVIVISVLGFWGLIGFAVYSKLQSNSANTWKDKYNSAMASRSYYMGQVKELRALQDEYLEEVEPGESLDLGDLSNIAPVLEAAGIDAAILKDSKVRALLNNPMAKGIIKGLMNKYKKGSAPGPGETAPQFTGL